MMMLALEDFVIFEFNLFVFAVIGVVFAIVWLIINFYNFYPIFRLFAARLLDTTQEQIYVDEDAIDEIDAANLPTIDILLPAYKEGNVIRQSISSIRNADYPQRLVTINVLTEPEDEDTRAALRDLEDEFEFRELTIPSEYHEIIVPDTYPGSPNKPRALNYGFEMSDSDIVGVIDAEDIVDEALFRHVVAGLVSEDRDFVQGILDMVNEHDGWLNTLFRAEYAWWFRWLLPSFHYSDYPVPLGGTTNFFHRSVLEDISDRRYEEYGDPWSPSQWEWFDDAGLTGYIPWDPKNVTEDFELGLFLWKEGYDIGLLRSVTREESPLGLNSWIRQRTRWQKGKIYTFIQYAYQPPTSWRARYHLLMQSFFPHIAPINIAGIVILALTANILGFGMPLGIFIGLTIGLVFLVMIDFMYAASYWYVSRAPLHKRVFRAIETLVTLPFYWLPLWGAELRSMRQIYGQDLSWEKTPHHGRNAADEPVAERSYSAREVAIGLAVLLFGLFIGFGLPLLFSG